MQLYQNEIGSLQQQLYPLPNYSGELLNRVNSTTQMISAQFVEILN